MMMWWNVKANDYILHQLDKAHNYLFTYLFIYNSILSSFYYFFFENDRILLRKICNYNWKEKRRALFYPDWGFIQNFGSLITNPRDNLEK